MKLPLKALLTLLLSAIAFCLLIVTYFLYFIITPMPTENMIRHELMKDKNVVEVKIQKDEEYSDAPVHELCVEILMEDGKKIGLYCFVFPLISNRICVTRINDIFCHGGRIFRLPQKEIFSEADDVRIYSQMLGIRLKSLSDVVRNVDALYELFELFEANSRKDFVYEEKFLVNADFSREIK